MLEQAGFIPNLIQFSQSYGRIMRAIQVAAAAPGIGLTEARVLQLLLDGPKLPSQIARTLVLDSGQITRLLAGLSAKGMVARTRLSRNRVEITLTDEGRVQATDVTARQHQAVARIWSELSEGERGDFLSASMFLGQHLRALDAQTQIRDWQSGETGILIQEAVRTFVGNGSLFDATLEKDLVAAFSRTLASKNIILVVERQRAIAGGLAITVAPSGNAGKIEFFAMFEYEQGMGRGTELLQVAISRARSAGLKQLTVDWPINCSVRSYFSPERGWLAQSRSRKRWGGQDLDWQTWSTKL